MVFGSQYGCDLEEWEYEGRGGSLNDVAVWVSDTCVVLWSATATA